MARIFFLLMLPLMAACAPMVAPPGPGPATPRVADTVFTTSDGLQLPVRRWLPQGEAKAVVLAAHGFNDYSKAFDKVPGAPGVGPYLAARGVAVYAYDQRGHGASPNPGVWAGTDAMVGDFKDLARTLKAQNPNVPLYGMGESMGGAVVMTALASAEPPPLDGAILAAPAVWARSTMPLTYRAALWLGARFLPGWRPTGRSLGRMASDNIEMLRDNSRDPLFIKQTRIDAVFGLTNLMDEGLASAPHVKIPVLYLYGKNDQIIPKKPTRQALSELSTANPNTHAAFYDNGWHMILRDKQAETVLADVAAYIADAKTPLPSGADVDALARLKAAKD